MEKKKGITVGYFFALIAAGLACLAIERSKGDNSVIDDLGFGLVFSAAAIAVGVVSVFHSIKRKNKSEAVVTAVSTVVVVIVSLLLGYFI